jgi:hypothetical protein
MPCHRKSSLLSPLSKIKSVHGDDNNFILFIFDYRGDLLHAILLPIPSSFEFQVQPVKEAPSFCWLLLTYSNGLAHIFLVGAPRFHTLKCVGSKHDPFHEVIPLFIQEDATLMVSFSRSQKPLRSVH